MPSIAEFWDGAAATFDHEPDHGLRDAAVRAAWAARLASWTPPGAVDVLDAGCGTGTLALALGARGHRSTLVDLSPAMLARARAKLAAAGIAAHLLQADAADPPLRPRSFDVVLARHLLWTLPDPVAALRRWVGLVRPRGRLIRAVDDERYAVIADLGQDRATPPSAASIRRA